MKPSFTQTVFPYQIVFRRKSDLLSSELDGDLVMMSIERGEYYGLGGTGPQVWALLEQPRSFRELVESICAEYAVEESTCAADLQTFLSILIRNGLVASDSPPHAKPASC